MPLFSGNSNQTRNRNVGHMLTKFKRTGKIGNTRPGSMKKAQQIASAAAYRKQRSGK